MNARNGQRVATFDVSGESALGWYYVMAHWPTRDTQPELRFGPGPLQVVFEAQPEVLYTLRCTLVGAVSIGGAVARSASRLLDILGTLLPHEKPPPRQSADAG